MQPSELAQTPIPTYYRDPAEASSATDTKSVALHARECGAIFTLVKRAAYLAPRMYHRVAEQELP